MKEILKDSLTGRNTTIAKVITGLGCWVDGKLGPLLNMDHLLYLRSTHVRRSLGQLLSMVETT